MNQSPELINMTRKSVNEAFKAIVGTDNTTMKLGNILVTDLAPMTSSRFSGYANGDSNHKVGWSKYDIDLSQVMAGTLTHSKKGLPLSNTIPVIVMFTEDAFVLRGNNCAGRFLSTIEYNRISPVSSHELAYL
jgi:hypothetical protein